MTGADAAPARCRECEAAATYAAPEARWQRHVITCTGCQRKVEADTREAVLWLWVSGTIEQGKRWCPTCGRCVKAWALLSAPSPFNPEDTLYACPGCKTVGEFVVLCDAPTCTKRATCGTQTLDVYRRTCHQHRPEP